MTERSRPWDGTTTGDATDAPYDAGTEWAELLRAGVFGADLATDKGGVLMGATGFGDYAASTPSANTTRVASGLGWVQGTWHRSDANVDVAIPTPSVSTRVDRIVLRKSWAGQTVRITRIAGTEGSGAPAMSQSFGVTWDVPLWNVSITTAGTITYSDQRRGVGAGAAHVTTLMVDSGNLGVGVAPNAVAGIFVAPTALTSVAQYGAQIIPSCVGATTSATGAYLRADVTGATVTTTRYGAYIAVGAKAGGATVTTDIGLNIEGITGGGTNNYGLQVGTPSGGATNNIGVLISGGAPALSIAAGGASIIGTIGVNIAPQTGSAIYVGGGGLTGVAQYGISSSPISSTGATSETTAFLAQAQTIASAYTTAVATGFHALNPIKGSTSHITQAYGLLVEAITAGETTNYGAFINTPSGASSNNIGIYITGGAPALQIAAGGLTVSGGVSVFAGNAQVGAIGSGYAASGVLRMAAGQSIAWRNAANSGDSVLGPDASNRVVFSGFIATQATVGAAGGASARPATPLAWMPFNYNGTNYVIALDNP